MTKNMNKKNQSGFTLIELAIVIVILALLTAGITSGISLVHSTKLKNIVNTMVEYKIAYEQFKFKYNSIPGDMVNATAYINTTVNGDGNHYIGENAGGETFGESQFFFQHLEAEGLITGNYDGSYPPAIGTSVPSTDFEQVTFWPYPWSPEAYVLQGSGTFGAVADRSPAILSFGKVTSASWPSSPAFSALDSFTIDAKFDDGIPGTGAVLGAPTPGVAGSGNCSTADTTAADMLIGEYNITPDEAIVCKLGMLLYWP